MSIVNNNDHSYDNSDDNNDNNNNDMLKLFQVFYLLNINKAIEQKMYIQILYILEKHGLLLKTIHNIENMIFHLNKLNLQESYKISILFYFKSNITILMSKVLKHYSKLNRLVNKNSNNLINSNKVCTAKKYLQNRLDIIKSFIKLSSANKDENINKLVINKNNTKFNSILRTEFINRLKNLRKYYELDVLRYIGVKLISYDDVCSMDIIELQKYYVSCVKNIKRHLTHWIKMICMYEQLICYLYENSPKN